MLFNSWAFCWLILITMGLYYLPWIRRLQVPILIAASFVFYGFQAPWLLTLLLASITLNAGASYAVAFGHARHRKRWAIAGVVANLALLAFFKYASMLFQTFSFGGPAASGVGSFLATIPLPIGISFFTFQGISLLVDTYRGKHVHSGGPGARPGFLKHWVDIACFKAFFPQLVAGPITKSHEFVPQIQPKRFREIDWQTAFHALVVGYFLKMVIADNLNGQTFYLEYPYFLGKSSLTLVALLFGYSMQIFADFAGYSLIAIGTAALFGYTLPKNFDFPYISCSFSEFWRRWHISLSSWLREYLYIPLGGNRKGEIRTYLNLMIVMFLGGLWHGAAWSYAVWGTWHGAALAVERYLQDKTPWLRDHPAVMALKMAWVFLYVTVGWLLFKLPDFHHVLRYFGALRTNAHLGHDYGILLNVTLYALPVIAYHLLYLVGQRSGDRKGLVGLRRLAPLAYGVLLFMILRNSGDSDAFIYFQF